MVAYAAKRAIVRRHTLFLLLCLFALIPLACSERAVSDVDFSRAGTLSFRPRFAYLGEMSSFAPINRIHLVARNVTTNTTVADTTFDVPPEAQEWPIGLSVPADAGTVIVTIELIHFNAGVSSIEWSGVTEPITVRPGETNAPHSDVVLFPGPPSNLSVTQVTIAPRNASVVEGATVQLNEAHVGGGPDTRIFWGSLDPTIASVDANGLVTTLRNGGARIVAQAGPRADTVVVTATQRIASVVVTPDTQRIATLGANATFTARVLDPRGADVTGATVTWTIADAAIADNLGAGQFRAKANGTTQVTATSATNANIRGTATLVVAQRAARVNVTPATATLNAIGAKQTFSAVVRDAAGNPITQAVRWRSANNAIATVDGAGVATATGAGSTQISAITGTGPDSVVGNATLQVTQAVAALEITPNGMTLEAIGDSVVFSVTARDANNNIMPNVKVTWSSANPVVVSIDSTGRAIALNNGSTVVTAQVGNVRGNASVTVAQRVTAVTVLPATSTLTAIGQQVALTANAADRRGNVVSGRRTVWSSSNSAVASVDTAGRVTARSNGTATIRADIDGAVGSASITVQQAAPSSLVISPDSAFINAIGFTTQLNATPFDASHVPMPTVRVTWSSLDPTIATVDSTGRVRAVAVGRARIVANATAADTAAVIVRQVPAHLSVALVIGTLAVGDSTQANASASDSNSVTIPNPSVVWSSSDTAVATVSASGIVKVRRDGSASITGRLGVLSSTVPLNVALPDLTVSAISLQPADSVLDTDSTLFTVTIKNIGAATAAASQTRVQLVDAATNVMLGDTIVAVGALTVNQSLTFANWIHPEFGPSGPARVYARVVIDTLNAVAESNEANNAGATAPIRIVHVVMAPPNLVMSAITTTPADTVLENDSLRVHFVIYNTGGSAAPPSMLRLSVLNAATPTAPAVDDTVMPLPAIAANDSLVVNQTLSTTGIGLFPDVIQLSVKADDGNAITEASETDNTSTSGPKVVKFVARTWLGNNTSWLDPINWSPAGLPRAQVDVNIPAGLANYPVLTSHAVVRNLTIAAGAKLDVDTFNITVTGDLDADSVVGHGRVFLTKSRNSARGHVSNLTANNSTIVNEYLDITHDLVIAGGDFDVNGYDVNVGGNLSTMSNGGIKMLNRGEINVQGNATFNGAATAGKMTGGSLTVRGDFQVLGHQAFVADTGHTVYLVGSSPQTVYISEPDSARFGEHFGKLYIGNPQGVTLNSHIAVNSKLTLGTNSGELTGNATVTLLGPLEDNSASGTSFRPLNVVFGRANMSFPRELFTNVFFVKPQALESDGNLTIHGNLTVSIAGDLQFDMSSVHVDGNFKTEGGGTITMHNEYDLLRVDGDALFYDGNTTDRITNGVISVGRMFDAQGPVEAFAATGNNTVRMEAPVDQPGGSIRFGSPGLSAQHFANLEISHATTMLSDMAVAGNITVNEGTGLHGVDFSVTVTGDINDDMPSENHVAPPQVNGRPAPRIARTVNANSSGMMQPFIGSDYHVTNTVLAGSTQQLPDFLDTNITVISDVTLSEFTQLSGDVTISGVGAILRLCDAELAVTNFSTRDGGRLQMTNSCDGWPYLDVSGNASFDGGSETGLLDAGEIYLTGSSFSAGSNPTAFESAGTGVFWSAPNATINLTSPATQVFSDLMLYANGSVSIPNGVVVNGIFEQAADSGFTTFIHGGGSMILRGDIWMANATLHGVPLKVERGTFQAFAEVTFENFAPYVDQLTIEKDSAYFTLHEPHFMSEPDSTHKLIKATGELLTVDVFNGTSSFYPLPYFEGNVFWHVPSDVAAPPVRTKSKVRPSLKIVNQANTNRSLQ